VLSAEDDVEAADREEVQRLGDGLAAAGNDAHGEMLSATEHDIAEVILQRARIATSTSSCWSPASSRRGKPIPVQRGGASDPAASAVLNPVGAAARAAGGLGRAGEPG